MILLFYFRNWGIEHGLINGDFAYMLVFLAVATSVRAGSSVSIPSLSATRSAARRSSSATPNSSTSSGERRSPFLSL